MNPNTPTNSLTTFRLIAFDESGPQGTSSNCRLVCNIDGGGKLAIWGGKESMDNINAVVRAGMPCSVACESIPPPQTFRQRYGHSHWVPESARLRVVEETRSERRWADWTEVMALVVAPLRPALLALAKAGLPPPEVGFELQGPGGEVVAEAELAWEAKRVAVLPDRVEGSPFVGAGWRVFSTDDVNLESQLRTVLIAEESS